MPRVRDIPPTVGLLGAIKALTGAIPEKTEWDADIECIKYRADKGEWKVTIYIKATDDVDGFMNRVEPFLSSKKGLNEFAYALTLMIDNDKTFTIKAHLPFHDEKGIPYKTFLASKPFAPLQARITELKDNLMNNYPPAHQDENAKKLILRLQAIALTKGKRRLPISEEEYKTIKGKYLLGRDAGNLVFAADDLANSLTDFVWNEYWVNYHSVSSFESAIKVMNHLIQKYRGKPRLSASDIESCKSSSEIGEVFQKGFTILKQFGFISEDYRFMPIRNLILGAKKLQRITESRFEEGEKTTTIKQICNLMYGHFRGVKKETHFYPLLLAGKILEFHHIVEAETKSMHPWDVVEAKIHYRGATADALYGKIKGKLDEAFKPLLKAYIHVKSKDRLRRPFIDLIKTLEDVKEAYNQVKEIGLDELRKKVDEGIKSISETHKEILEAKNEAVKRELFLTPELEELIEQKLGKSGRLQEVPTRLSGEKDLRDKANDFVTVIAEMKDTAQEFEDSEYYLFAQRLYEACIDWAQDAEKMLKWANVYRHMELLRKIGDAINIQANNESILVSELKPIISTSIKKPTWQKFFSGFAKHYGNVVKFENEELVNLISRQVEELHQTLVEQVLGENSSKYEQIHSAISEASEKISNFSPEEPIVEFPKEIDKKSRILVVDIENFQQTFNSRQAEAIRWTRTMDKLLEVFPEKSKIGFRERIRLNSYSIKRLALPSTYDDAEAWVDVVSEFANCYYSLKTLRNQMMESIEPVVKGLFPNGTPIDGLKSPQQISKTLKELVEIKEKHPEVSTLNDLCDVLDIKSIFDLWKDKEKLNLFMLSLLFDMKGIPLL